MNHPLRKSVLVCSKKWRARSVKLEEDRKQGEQELKLKEDHLEKSRRLADMDQHRHMLVAGDPCPLCGSVEHPYAGGAPDPGMEEIVESKRKAEEALKQVLQRESSFNSSRDKVLEREKEMLDALEAVKKKEEEVGSVFGPVCDSFAGGGRGIRFGEKFEGKDGHLSK